jgi:lactam utilization protein B
VDSLNTQLQTAADRNTNLTGQLTTAQASNARLTSDNNALRQVAEVRWGGGCWVAGSVLHMWIVASCSEGSSDLTAVGKGRHAFKRRQ